MLARTLSSPMLRGTWQTPTFARLLAVVTAVALVAGCSADRATSPLASGSQPISLSFAVANSTVPVSGSRLVARDIQVGGTAGAARTVTITGVQAVLANLRLRILGGTCSPGPGDFKRCNYVSQTPMLVSLPVNGALTTAIKATVPAATYSGMQLEIAAIRSDSGDHGENGTASEEAARAAFIKANIEHAFHGFRDDHRTGVDEHGEPKSGGDSKADSHPNAPPAGAPRDTTHHR